jgi:hypothetical protein
MPLVSILMNSRNAAGYLDQAVRSVLGQTYPLIELIVSEASDDEDGVALLRAWDDPRLVVVRDTDRRGWAHGINLADAEATGDLVLFCSGDDVFQPSAIERMVAQLTSSPAGCVVAPVRGVDKQGVPLGRCIVVPEEVRREPTWVRLFERNYIVVAMTRRGVLPRPLIDESVRGVGGDWDLWLHLVQESAGFTYLDEMLFDYRVHDGSLVATEGDTRTDMRNVLERIGWPAIRAAYERSALSREDIDEGLANIAVTMGEHDLALQYWLRRAAQTSDAVAAVQAGALLLILGHGSAAEAMLRRVALPGRAPDAWNNLGVALGRRALTTEARSCFDEALRQLPLYRDARLNRASDSPTWITERPLRPLDQILR